MNALQLNLDLISNKFYEFFWRSPRLFVNRVENKLAKVGWKPRFNLPAQTDAMSWIREELDFHTRLYIFNYWTDHYGISDRMPVNLEIRDASGHLVASDRFELKPREMYVLEASEFLKKNGLTTPFLGSFILKRATPGPGWGVPFKLLQEYYGQRFLSCVHEYSTVDNFSYHEYQVGVSVWGNDDVDDIEIAVANCNIEKQEGTLPLTVELYDSTGRKTRIHRTYLAPAQAMLLSMNQIYPDWKNFLSTNQPGNIALDFPNPIGRPIVFHRYHNQVARGSNHLSGDKSRTPYVIKGETLKSIGLGPVFAAGVLLNEEITTEITLFMNWGFNIPFDVEGKLFDKDGTPAGTFREHFNPWETKSLRLIDYLDRTKVKLPWVGSVRLYPLPNASPRFIPYTFDANVEFVGKGWRQPVNLGSSILNMSQKANVKSPYSGRTKNFMRVRDTDIHETYILMVNQSSDTAYASPSDTTVRLISMDGQRESVQKISLPASGTLFTRIRDLFPDADGVMGNQPVATFHIRDTQVKLLGIHLLRDKRTGVLAGDHYFGG
jgi:hypothetical protein